MTITQARLWIVYASLIATGTAFVFFCFAPAIGYPLRWDDALRLLEITLPTFVGYLGSAVHFMTLTNPSNSEKLKAQQSALLPLVVRGPAIVFAVACASAIAGFGISNRSHAPAGVGMSVDTLAGILAAALGVLTASTSVVVGRLFGAAPTSFSAVGEKATP